MKKRRERRARDGRSALTAVLIWVGCIVLAVIIAAIIGNALGKEAGKINPGGENGAPEIFEYKGQTVPSVSATAVINPYGKSDDGIDSIIASLPSGTTAVSIYLKAESLAPSYKSAVYTAVSGNTGGRADLSRAVRILHDKNIRVCACFDATSPSVNDKDARDAALNYEAALISEALAFGIDDITICGLPSDSYGVAYASELFKIVREKNPSSVLGAGIPYKVMMSSAAAGAISDYSSFADYCAVDMSDMDEDLTEESVVSGLSYYFLEYPIRVILMTGEISVSSRVEALGRLGIYNVQVRK